MDVIFSHPSFLSHLLQIASARLRNSETELLLEQSRHFSDNCWRLFSPLNHGKSNHPRPKRKTPHDNRMQACIAGDLGVCGGVRTTFLYVLCATTGLMNGGEDWTWTVRLNKGNNGAYCRVCSNSPTHPLAGHRQAYSPFGYFLQNEVPLSTL